MVKIGHASIDENGSITGGQAGDQTGREVFVQSWYNKGWNKVIRPLDPEVAEKMATAMEAVCRNDRVGYDQNQRTTLYDAAAAVNWDIDRITTPCECDCSSLMAVCAAAAGIKVSKSIYTGNEAAAFQATGRFEILTDSKYLTGEDYLRRGDILLKEYSHTAMVLSNGSNVYPEDKTNGNVLAGQRWLNVYYAKLIKQHKGSLMAEDGEYGPETRAAALCVWKDVVNRKFGSSLTPANENFFGSCKKAAEKAVIAKGDSGTLPLIAQLILSANGNYTGDMDTKFEDGMDAATRAFQAAKGLEVDGVIGPETWYALFN